MFERSSGVLLHVSSLPGPYGIGDLGPGAHAWVDWLAEAGRSPLPKPWVLFVSFVSPHYPLTVPDGYQDL